ncbi:MAG: zinc metallopeptidase, partial [Clostridia bacterium]
MFWDLFYFGPWSILILLPGLLLGIYAQARVSSTYNKYGRIGSQNGITANLVAREMLNKADIHNVSVTQIAGKLTDNYNPKTETVSLSQGVYDSTSVASIGIAAHEIGHVIQKHKGYFPMKVRSFLVPVINFGNMAFVPLLLVGLLIEMFANQVTGISNFLINLAVFSYGLATVFAFITLPVEFNASRRAKKLLVANGILSTDEARQAGKVLDAAALTYVAGFLTSLLYFL